MLGIISPARWQSALAARGFRDCRGGSTYQLNGLTVALDRDWLVAKTSAETASDLLDPSWRGPGLWKLVADRAQVRREFHLPLGGIDEFVDDPWDDGQDAAVACLDWILATAAGDLPEGWQCPSAAEVESWLPPDGLMLEFGPHLRQGAVECRPGCLALRMPVAPSVRKPLAPIRQTWLRRLLVDAQNRWRMVRFGLSGPGDRPAAYAQIDFSGAPHALLESCLLKAGLDALRWVASWLAWPTGLLADARVECRALDAWQHGLCP